MIVPHSRFHDRNGSVSYRAPSRKQDGWHATLTDAGNYYLEHGEHPDRMRKSAGIPKGDKVDADDTRMRKQRVRVDDVPIGVREFLARLEAGQGEIRVVGPTPAVRSAWRRILHAARVSGELPDGWHLLHRGRDSGDLVIELRPGDPSRSRYAKPFISRIQLPDSLAAPHPVVAELRDHPHRPPNSDANRLRALLIAQGLIDQLQPRGLTAARCDTGPAFSLGDDLSRTVVTFDEQSGARWTLRLSVEVTGPGRGEVQRWVDREDWKIEDGLGAVVEYIAEQVDAVRRHKNEQERLRRGQQARQRQQG